MTISEIRIKLVGADADDHLLAFCSVTFDRAFVIRDLKIICNRTGLFVAMPDRRLMDHCPACRRKNHLLARFCNACGARLPDHRVWSDADGKIKLHADVAHPVTPAARQAFEVEVIAAYHAELEAAKRPGYVSSYAAHLQEMA